MKRQLIQDQETKITELPLIKLQSEENVEEGKEIQRKKGNIYYLHTISHHMH